MLTPCVLYYWFIVVIHPHLFHRIYSNTPRYHPIILPMTTIRNSVLECLACDQEGLKWKQNTSRIRFWGSELRFPHIINSCSISHKARNNIIGLYVCRFKVLSLWRIASMTLDSHKVYVQVSEVEEHTKQKYRNTHNCRHTHGYLSQYNQKCTYHVIIDNFPCPQHIHIHICRQTSLQS